MSINCNVTPDRYKPPKKQLFYRRFTLLKLEIWRIIRLCGKGMGNFYSPKPICPYQA